MLAAATEPQLPCRREMRDARRGVGGSPQPPAVSNPQNTEQVCDSGGSAGAPRLRARRGRFSSASHCISLPAAPLRATGWVLCAGRGDVPAWWTTSQQREIEETKHILCAERRYRKLLALSSLAPAGTRRLICLTCQGMETCPRAAITRFSTFHLRGF